MRSQSRERSHLGGVGRAVLAALLVAPSTAWAQADTEPPLPNVMLLIDTSGSMEYMAEPDPITKKPRLPNCAKPSPANSQTYSIAPGVTYEQNRWTNLVTVLTGEIPQYACVAESRSTGLFSGEFGISGQKPYDQDYYLPYNRIVSTNGTERCVVGPNPAVWPGANMYSYPADSIRTHRVGDNNQVCTKINGEFRLLQTDDGLLDVFRDKARFGLMTFDSLPSKEVGINGNSIDAAKGIQGHWSYFPGWDSGPGGHAKGKPELCATDQEIEVGVRNPAAPPWEGRLIGFGDPAAAALTVAQRNEQIQQTIMAVRPYGATPLAGMLSDAEHFFFQDNSTDKSVTGQVALGPMNDPYVLGGCRQQFVILLTDGIPNLDLRPGCRNNNPGPPDGTCPFAEPSAVAKRLYSQYPNKQVRTFVVGFAVSSADTGGPINLDCKGLTGQNDAVCINPATEAVRACCEMAKIAYEGGTGKPRFADNKQELRKALNDILSEVSQSTTSRTTPVFASAGSAGGGYSGGSGVAAYNILTSFKVSTGGLWQGVLERQRYTCDKDSGVYTVVPQPISEDQGDRFAVNMTLNQSSRRFITVVPDVTSKQPDAERSVRRLGTIADGVSTLAALQINGLQGDFYSSNIAAAMELAVGNAAQSVCGTIKTPVSVNDCRNRILRWYTGLPMVDGSLFDRVDSPMGSIFHSTPVVVGPPSEFLRDESYSAFADKYKTRAPVVYTATTDGQLHAFKLGASSPNDTVKVDTKAVNNELWSFVPPAVLTDLKTIYPGVERRLLDVPIFARDVVFERKREDSINGAGSFNDWRSVLVTGLGPSRGGYFAMDVTTPEFKPPDSNGPTMLWQLTTDDSGNPLFGASVSPVITTIFVRTPNMPEAREVAVAILPGGTSAPPANSAPVNRAQSGGQTADGKWAFRPKVRSYSEDDPSRSLTIVRLDNGEVIRRFHRCKSNNAPPRPYSAALVTRSACTNFDSPITSVPLPFPNGTGQSSTRVFVGDQDGALWRIDLSNPDPAQWKVDPFFDAYSPYPNDPNIGQPILSQPVASLDPLGNLVVAFATGDQDRFNGTLGMRNVLWSVSEVPDLVAGKVGSRANWHLGIGNNETISASPAGSANSDWANGIRVAGPLSLFGGAVYFSTYRPPLPGGAACDPGSSVLWAVDYLKNTANSPTGDAGPAAALDLSGQLFHAREYANALIFGVGIQRLPACYDTSTVDDPYIGFGTGSTAVSEMTRPEYKLVVQTGSKGVSNAQSETKFETLNLRPPPSGALISSWASVVELEGST